NILGELHNIKIVLDEAVLPGLANRDLVTLRLQGDELRFALMHLLSPLGLTYMLEGDHLLVATPDEVRRRGGTPAFDDGPLLAKLVEKYPGVRWFELRRGAAVEPDDLTRLRDVLSALSDADPDVQLEACRIIGSFESEAKVAVPRLEKLTRHEDVRMRRLAYRALFRIGDADLSTLPILLAGLERGDEAAGENIRRLLNGNGESASPPLEAAYRDGSVATRRRLLVAVLSTNSPLPAIVKLSLADANPELRLCTLQRLQSTQPSGEFSELVRPFLRSTIRSERRAAAQRLAHVKDDANAAVGILIAVSVLINDTFADGTATERRDSRTALVSLRSHETKRHAARLLRARMEKDLQPRWIEAAALIIELTPHDATEVIERLAKQIEENATEAALAADALANGPALSECATVLNQVLAEVSIETRLHLARATIPLTNPSQRKALHLLLLDDPDPSVVRQTIESMRRDSVCELALPKLKQLAESGPEIVREAAQRVVASLTPPPLTPQVARSNKWGTTTRDGLRAQIALRTAEPAVGQPLTVTLFVKNEADVARTVAHGQAPDPRAFEIIGTDGRAVSSLTERWQPEGPVEIEPGEIWSFANVRLDELYLFDQPGRYTIRFVGRND
ncbi:MAG: HEAT repeat domain-containing protein, partial [Candidatus Saccharimonas sp.]|nr:HEAT repeat domain-containing protein [Planctomycetaceae bacterium]